MRTRELPHRARSKLRPSSTLPSEVGAQYEWTAFDGDRYVFGNARGPVGFVCNTPFGWIYAWEGGTEGPFASREAAMVDVEGRPREDK